MAMTWTSLVAPKGTAGSIMNWVSYSKLDQVTCVDEAQSLIFQSLRVREMRTMWTFGMPVGGASIVLPARFLDPAGTLTDAFGNRYEYTTDSVVTDARSYDTSLSGSFGTDPFTSTGVGSPVITAVRANHGLTPLSDITISGATAVDGITINGTSLVNVVIDANIFQFLVLDAQATTGGVTGGGSAATYTANKLISGQPRQWAIRGVSLQFDAGFDTATQFRLPYYRSPALLSANTTTNFLTDRYPMLMRKACMASAADFMKDDTEYQKQVSALNALIQSTAAGDDLIYRGAEFGTDTP